VGQQSQWGLRIQKEEKIQLIIELLINGSLFAAQNTSCKRKLPVAE
jgi:hypothetical protein